MLKIIQRTFSRFQKLEASHFLTKHNQPHPIIGAKSQKKPMFDDSEMKKVQSFIKQQTEIPGNDLNANLLNFSKRDEEFQKFLQEVKEKKEWKQIYDPEETRKQIIEDLYDIRQRNNLEKFIDQSYKALGGPSPKAKIAKMQHFVDVDKIIDSKQFRILFIQSGSTTNVTKLNRVNSRRVLLVMGNGHGLVSYGKGKGVDYNSAFNECIRDCFRNLIAIDLDLKNTCPVPLYGEHNDVKIKLMPSQPGHFQGSPMIYNMLNLAGLHHCRYFEIGRNRNPYSIVYAFFNAIRNNRTVKKVAEDLEIKLSHIGRYTYY